MNVGSVETAWTKETNSHSRAGSNQSWESLPIGNNDTTSTTSGNVDLTGWVSEVEKEILVSEQSNTIKL
jgi:hypothetical protein